MSDQQPAEAQASGDKATVTLPGVVEKIVKSPIPSEPEKAQIAVEGADHLYREIRVENRLKDADGNTVALKPGAEVAVTIEAEPHAIKPADDSKTPDPSSSTRGQ
jgi:hypothetical protein